MVYSGFYRRSFLVATAAVLAYLLLEVLEPLKGALGWAVVLAFLLHPLHERLSRRLKGRGMLSAGIITCLTPFFVLAPLSVLGVVFAGQVANLIGYLRGQVFSPIRSFSRGWRAIRCSAMRCVGRAPTSR